MGMGGGCALGRSRVDGLSGGGNEGLSGGAIRGFSTMW